MKAGDRVTIPGFGTWQQTLRTARSGVNPQTRQKLQIPAQTVEVNWQTATALLKAALATLLVLSALLAALGRFGS